MDDHYHTLAGRTETRQKIARSEFLGVAFSTGSERAFFEELTRLEKAHFDATHHCWAYRLRDRARCSDAGEPAGTAGRPILNALESAGLYDTGVVVVRWYGGVKLGSGGLSRAYRESASIALAAAARVDRYEYATYSVSVPFDSFGSVYRLVDPPHVLLAGETYSPEPSFQFQVRRSRAEAFATALRELQLSFEPWSAS